MKICEELKKVLNIQMLCKKHKYSAIGKHLQEEHRLQPTNLQDQFRVLKKCRTKFDCLIYEMLFIRNIKPKLNTQSDSVRAKPFYITFEYLIPFSIPHIFSHFYYYIYNQFYHVIRT